MPAYVGCFVTYDTVVCNEHIVSEINHAQTQLDNQCMHVVVFNWKNNCHILHVEWHKEVTDGCVVCLCCLNGMKRYRGHGFKPQSGRGAESFCLSLT